METPLSRRGLRKVPGGLRKGVLLLEAHAANILVLDDEEVRLRAFRAKLIGNVVLTVKTVEECISALENATWDYVFLDHDLGGKILVESGKGTGYEVAEWLSNHPEKKPKHIIVHSFNAAGAKNMLGLLPEAKYIPGIWTL